MQFPDEHVLPSPQLVTPDHSKHESASKFPQTLYPASAHCLAPTEHSFAQVGGCGGELQLPFVQP